MEVRMVEEDMMVIMVNMDLMRNEDIPEKLLLLTRVFLSSFLW